MGYFPESQEIFQLLREGLLIVDSNGIIKFINTRAKELFKHGGLDLSPGDRVPPHPCFPHPLSAREQSAGLWQEKDLCLQYFIFSLYSETESWLVGIYEDVTEIEYLRKENQELNMIFNHSYDPIVVADGHANLLRVGPHYKRITDIDPAELLGKNMRELVKTGFVDQSVTLKVLEARQPQTVSQRLANGKEILLTGNPVFENKAILLGLYPMSGIWWS